MRIRAKKKRLLFTGLQISKRAFRRFCSWADPAEFEETGEFLILFSFDQKNETRRRFAKAKITLPERASANFYQLQPFYLVAD